MSINSERESLMNLDKTFFSISKKTKTLTRLKLDFFEKMKFYEQEENIEKAYAYFGYLVRATNLSQNIYSRIYNELLDLQKVISVNNQTAQTGDVNLDISLNCLFKDLESFILDLNTFLKNMVSGENLIVQVQNTIKEEKGIMENIDHKADRFFNELNYQKALHNALLKEEELTKRINLEIERLLSKSIKTFQKIKLQIKTINANAMRIANDFKNKPLTTTFSPIEKAGLTLESHASIFAATIFGISILSNISALAGIASIAIVGKEIILLMAEIGEPLQAIPAMKKGYYNMTAKIKQFANTAFSRMDSVSNI